MVKTTTQGGAMIKEYLIETTTIEDTVISRVITNDPNYWLTKVGVVTIHEIDRGNYYLCEIPSNTRKCVFRPCEKKRS